jgi:ribosome-associated protein
MITFANANLKYYMGKKPVEKKSDVLTNTIIESIKEHKGKEVISLNLKNIETAVCDFFIICHGTSNTHISSIVQNVRKDVSKLLLEKPWHIEGENNQEWILMDYFDVVVHIFNKEKRDFYKLENLWADAQIKYIEQSA